MGEPVYVNSRGMRLHLALDANGIGKVLLDGIDISHAAAGVVIECEPGETARATLTLYLSELDVDVAGAVVERVPESNSSALTKAAFTEEELANSFAFQTIEAMRKGHL